MRMVWANMQESEETQTRRLLLWYEVITRFGKNNTTTSRVRALGVHSRD